MELKERIKKARKEAGFKSQGKLAEFLGTTRPAIASYELGRVIPNDVFLQLMAAKLDISYDWLKYGAGKMHIGEKITPPLEGLDDDDRAIMMIYAELPPAHRKILKNFAVQVAATQAERQDLPAALPKVSESAPNAAETQREPPLRTIEVTEEEYLEFMRERTAREFEQEADGLPDTVA